MLFRSGGIDLAETAEDAAKRELFEETGLVAKKLSFFKLYSGEITHYVYYNGDEIYGVDAVYLCDEYEGQLCSQKEEVKRLFFTSIDEVPEKMSIRNKQIILDLKESFKK